MKIHIQNMVSRRCIMMVQTQLEKLGIAYKSVELGVAILKRGLSDSRKKKLQIALHQSGLELMYDEKVMLIEKVVNLIVEMVHHAPEFPKVNFSEFIGKQMQQDYHKLSEIFSKTKGITIEHFIILHKVEKVKELIIYDDLSLTEISYKMDYSSVAHLSKQFKQVTGFTPTFFKSIAKRKRTKLEDL
jgi:AraC-like DNA-binding protein